MEPSFSISFHFTGIKLLWSKVADWLLFKPIIFKILFTDTIIDWCINIEVIVAEETPSILWSLFFELILKFEILLFLYVF